MLDFPNTPNEGDVHTEKGTTWTYRSGAWVLGAKEGTNIQIVDSGIPDANWQVWGDALIQWGTAQADGSGAGTATFPVAYKSGVPPRVSGVVMRQPGAGQAPYVVMGSGGAAGTGSWSFNVRTGSGADVPDTDIDWVAIGEAPDNLKQPKEVPVTGSGLDPNDYVQKSGDTMTGVLTIEGSSGVPVVSFKRTDNAVDRKNGLIAKNSDGSIGIFGQSDDGQTLTNHASFGRQETDNRLYSPTYVENDSINSGIFHVKGNNYPFMRLTCNRAGVSYRHAGIIFDTPRSDTADGATSGGRAMIKSYGDSTSTGNPILMITTQSSNLQPNDGYSTDRDGNGNAMIMQGTGGNCQILFYNNSGVLAGEISGAYDTDPSTHASGLFMTRNKCDQRYAQTAALEALTQKLEAKGMLDSPEVAEIMALTEVDDDDTPGST